MDENEEKSFYELELKKDLIPIIGYLRYSLKLIRNNYKPVETPEDLQNRRKAKWNHFTLFTYNIVLSDLVFAYFTGNSLLAKLFE